MNVIKVLRKADVELPQIIKKGNWIDLRISETVTLKAGEYKLLPLGVCMKLPTGTEGHVLPRSSTFKNWGIIMTNSMGIIDSAYCGDNDMWHFPALATRDVTIQKGSRICQFRIINTMAGCPIVEVYALSDENRGGFGSTGVD